MNKKIVIWSVVIILVIAAAAYGYTMWKKAKKDQEDQEADDLKLGAPIAAGNTGIITPGMTDDGLIPGFDIA